MDRHYAGPLGRLARLLLWSRGEITLTPNEREHLLRQTRTTVVVLEALHTETKADGLQASDPRQTKLPWE